MLKQTPSAVHMLPNQSVKIKSCVAAVQRPTLALTCVHEGFRGLLTVIRLERNKSDFKLPLFSSPCSKEPANGPLRDPQSSSRIYNFNLSRSILFSSHLRLVVSNDLFPYGVQPIFCTQFLFSSLVFDFIT